MDILLRETFLRRCLSQYVFALASAIFFFFLFLFSACSLDPPSANHYLARLSAFPVPGERFAVLSVPAAMFVGVHMYLQSTAISPALFSLASHSRLSLALAVLHFFWQLINLAHKLINYRRNRQNKIPPYSHVPMVVEVAVCEGRA